MDESCVPPQAVDQTEYVVSFDDETLERKRAAGDDVLYIDARQQGSAGSAGVRRGPRRRCGGWSSAARAARLARGGAAVRPAIERACQKQARLRAAGGEEVPADATIGDWWSAAAEEAAKHVSEEP